MSFTPFGIALIILLVLLLIFQRKLDTRDVERFYNELEIGDIYDHVSDGNVFIQPVEVLTVIDKKSGYIKYTLWIRKTGEVIEKSCSGSEFFDKVCYFGLIKRENALKNDPSKKP